MNFVDESLSSSLQHQCALVSAGELKNLAQLLQEILVSIDREIVATENLELITG